MEHKWPAISHHDRNSINNLYHPSFKANIVPLTALLCPMDGDRLVSCLAYIVYLDYRMIMNPDIGVHILRARKQVRAIKKESENG